MEFLDSHGSRRITRRLYGKLGESNCQKPTLKRLSSILPKINKGGKRSKKKKTNFERNYCKLNLQQSSSKRNRTRTGSTFLEKKEVRRPNYQTRSRTPPTEEKRRPGQISKTNTPQTERTTRFNEIEDETETEPTSPDWRQRRQTKGKFPMTGNPSARRTERITKQSDKPNWRSRRWEKPIPEDESPSLASKTEMSIKLVHDDEQSQRSRLKEIIRQRIVSQSIALPTKKTIEEIAEDDEDERNLRN